MITDRRMVLDSDTRLLLVSDAHLGAFDEAENRRIEEALIALADYAEEHGFRLAILGDLFDYWMEYTDFHPGLAPDLLERLCRFNASHPILYITGNHDNWTGSYLRGCGFDLEQDYRVIQQNGILTLLHHGDGMADPRFNLPRPLLHRILRNSEFIRLYQALFPPRIGLSLMRLFSDLSRYFEDPEEERPGTLDRWAEEQLAASDVDVIICGHDHTPRIRDFAHGRYINLGAFCEHATVAAYTNAEWRLVEWNSRQRKLLNFDPLSV